MWSSADAATGDGTERSEAAVPPPRLPPEGGATSTSADVLRGLGLDALVEMLEGSGYGVCITGDDHRWVYLNPAGCRLVGRSFAELRGEDYLLSFPEHERDYLLALESDQRGGDTGFYANTVVRPDGTEVGITWSGTVLHADGRELAPAIFHPTFGLGRAGQDGADPGGAAALGEDADVEDVLGALAEEAVDRSRAVACLVLVEGPAGRLALRGCAGVPDEPAPAVADAGVRLTDLPGGDLLVTGRLVLLSDGSVRLAGSAATARLAAATAGLDWAATAAVPLRRGGAVVGCLVLLLPATVTAATKGELTTWSALAAHASVALADERLREQAALHAAELERHRLGRDLHDSVNAALFSVHARAQAVRRGLDAGAPEVVAEAARDLEALTGEAIRQLRAMVSDMRTEVSSATDLPAVLRELVRTCEARDGLPVRLTVTGGLLPVAAPTTEHLVRIAGEALHNTVKHAGGSGATVALEVTGSDLVLTVVDDGRGFDPAAATSGGHGQRTMRERARLCGGSLHVDSAAGRGTRVVVRVPLPA